MTVWYDFTTTLRATGRNGIAAAEWNLGTALLAAEPSTRCFALEGRNRLVPIDPTVDLRNAVYASTIVGRSATTTAPPTWRDRVRVRLWASLGPQAVPLIRAMSAVYQFPADLRRALSSRAPRSGGKPILDGLVEPGDVVVSMGADWSGELVMRLLELKQRTGCRVVTMVYDMIPLTHRHLAFHNDPMLFDSYYRRVVAVSDLITCISEQSRQDLIAAAARRGWQLPTTRVLRLGEDAPDDATGEAGPVDEYFLWVGTVERRKNLELLYDALRIIESEGGEPPRLVVAGAVGWGVDDLIVELDLQSTKASRAIVLLGAVDDAALDRLYGKAQALLFPSHYEGWGLPVREAAIRGCPVAAGDSPAVREAVAGCTAAELLPVDDPGPWADYMRAAPARPDRPAPVRSWGAVAAELARYVTDVA